MNYPIRYQGGTFHVIDNLSISGSTVNVEILPSATKHGQSRDDNLCALEQSIYDETLEADPNKALSIGYDGNAKLLKLSSMFYLTSI